MNILKKSGVALLGAALLVGVSSCTGEFENINTNPIQIADTDVSLGDYFNEAQLSIFYNQSNGDYEYQLIQNLNADLFSGYCAIPTAFNGGRNNDNYFMMNGWNNWTLNYMLLHVVRPTKVIEQMDITDDMKAIATIMKVTGAHKMVDTYGPVPYSKAMGDELFPTYDSEEDCYKSFLSDLENATAALTKWLDANGGKDDAGRLAWDNMAGKSQTRWLQFGNTMRLRLAMRCAMVNPSLAKQHAEAAAANKYGLLKDADIEVKNDVTKNPQIICARNYNDCGISANYETILKGYNDPRLALTVFPVGWGPKYNKGDIIDEDGKAAGLVGQIKGIRNGLVVDGSSYKMYSIPMPAANFDPLSVGDGTPYANLVPLPIMNRAEASFLQAEGALRGWSMGGTAQSFYEEGIKNSFAKYGLDAAEYLAGTTTQIDYVDPHNSAYNIAAVNKVPVKFMVGGSNEEQLQQIITQKWIAGFPEGLNAWAEYRRTGYPKLFPIPSSNCNVQPEYITGSVDALVANGPRRLMFTEDEAKNNPAGYQSGKDILSARGQKDAIDSRLWWDTGKNF